MNGKSFRKLRYLLFALVACLIATGVLLSSYMTRKHTAAQALIDSARAIRSGVDAEREIAILRRLQDGHFVDEPVQSNGDHSYSFELDNGLVHTLHLEPPSVVTLSVTMHGDELRGLALVMYTGSQPDRTAMVWIQEYVDVARPNGLRVQLQGSKATVDFSSTLPEAQRQKIFALNTRCFVTSYKCSKPEDILPTLLQLHSDVQ